MFVAETYRARRRAILQQLPSDALAFLPGNVDSPMNYADNIYPFRQDSTFLYCCGLQQPELALILDNTTGETTLYGDDLSLDHIVWMGDQPTMAERAQAAGIEKHAPLAELDKILQRAQQSGRSIHILPPYRAENTLRLAAWLQVGAPEVSQFVSDRLTRAVIGLRSIKSAEEVAEMEIAVNTSGEMHRRAMQEARAGQEEAIVAGLIEGIAIAGGGRLSYPAIVTRNGHILHNHYHGNTLRPQDLLLIDAGASSVSQYAGDITRTFPIARRFTEQQAAIYELVLRALEQATAMLRPGLPYRDAHLAAARILTQGLIDIGLMQGDADEAVAAGAHALFFPHGLGHMIGLDVHDMEDLGEDWVGYDEEVRRSDQFGLRSLRLGKRLQPGFVLTVEPGLYFIPALIDRWQADGMHTDFIRYERLAAYRDFGGVRIEDNVLITDDSHRVLGKPIPKSINEIEAIRSAIPAS
ncbi:MAG: aminopeptidase P family protein [Lewinella sp.]|nr:aminopeptidase P family protein [Lewinella sp.]